MASASLLFAPVVASAQLTPGGTGLTAAAQGTGLTNVCGAAAPTACVANIVGRAIQVLLGLIGIVLFVLLIYAGFQWMTAGGDTKKVTEARTTIVNAVAGIVVIAASYAVATFILSQLVFVATGSSATPTGGAGSAADICATYDCVGSAAFCSADPTRAGCEDHVRCGC